jgi:outer membrane protein assembly factor BamB
VIGAGVLFLGVIYGSFELAGRSRLGSLERRYSELQRADPSGNDADAWVRRSSEYQALARDLDGFAESFRIHSKASEASQLALTCWQASAMAQRASDLIRSGNGADVRAFKSASEEIHQSQLRVLDAAKELKKLEDAKRFTEAAAKAISVWEEEIKRHGLDKTFQARINIPVEVTTSPPGTKVYSWDGKDWTLLGETPANGSPLIVHARPFASFKLEGRRAKFRSAGWEKLVTSYESISLGLERESHPPVSLGKFGPFRCFRDGNKIEEVRVDARFTIDTQAQTIVFVTRQGDLRSVDYQTGHRSWDPVPVGNYGDMTGGPEVLPGQAIFTAGCNGIVSAQDANTGAVVWTQTLGSPVVARPRLTSDGKAIVVATVNGDIVLLAADGGSVRWSVPTEIGVELAPATRGNVVYAASRDGKLRSIDIPSGKVLAIYDALDAITAGPVLAGDRLYVGTKGGRVHAVGIDNPTKAVFVSDPAGAPVIDLAAAGEVVYYATPNDVHAVMTKTGAQVFAPYQPGAPIVGIAPMTDRVALVTESGIVTALDGQSGEVAWWKTLRGPKGETQTVGAPPITLGEDMFIVTREGWLIDVVAD